MTEADKAYAAGLFDGEGCVSFYRSKVLYPVLAVGMTDESVVRWLHAGWGGSVTTVAGTNKPMHFWRVVGRNAQGFATDIRPYLRVKLAQIDAVSHLFFTKRGQYTAEDRESVRRQLVGLR